MQFNSAPFAVFIAAVFGLIGLSSSTVYRKWLLLLASYVFYIYLQPQIGLLLFGLTAASYLTGVALHRVQVLAQRRLWLIAGICMMLAPLITLKYTGFLAANANAMLHWFDIDPMFTRYPFLAPIGVSFITFRVLSYVLDVYWRRCPPARCVLDYGLYVAFFPQLIAGPIMRAREFLPQLERPLVLQFTPSAVLLICGGLVKKAVIADNLAPIADTVFGNISASSRAMVWLGAAAYCVQIYCDFSGYSDIAIGLTRLLGFPVGENFDRPYLARNPVRFWQKWHISLSTWMRDYVYFPLGGMDARRRWLALLGTMVITGLWHGAAWVFILWGAYHGVLLIVYRLYSQWLRQLPSVKFLRKSYIVKLASWCGFQFLVLMGWVLFRSESVAGFGSAILKMLAFNGQIDLGALAILPLATLAGLYCLFWISHLALAQPKVQNLAARLPIGGVYLVVAVTTAALIILWPQNSPPFIYAQF